MCACARVRVRSLRTKFKVSFSSRARRNTGISVAPGKVGCFRRGWKRLLWARRSDMPLSGVSLLACTN